MAATQLSIYQMALRFLADARLALISDDVESRYALDDAWLSAPSFVLRQAGWRFALKTAALAAGGALIPGYATSYLFPADWIRTHAVFLTDGKGRELPFDFREQGSALSVNTAAPLMRYVSNAFINPVFANWPEHFAECVAAYLAFLVAWRVTGDQNAATKMSQLFASLLPQAVKIDAIDDDPWLDAQRDGTFLRVARTMIDQGFWRFAMKNVQMTTIVGGNGGFARQVAIPTDWSRTRSLYVLTTDRAPTGAGERRPFKVREQAGFWYTDAASFYAEYVSSTLAMDSTKWPDHYMRAVLRAIHFDMATRDDDKDQKDDLAVAKDALHDTMDSEAISEDPWLEYQLDGTFDTASRAVISRGYWWWGIKTLDIDVSSQESAAAHTGFPYRFPIPPDWLQTHALFVAWDGQECPINIRETNADWSTDAPAWTARYVSTDVLDATTWPEMVGQAVLAYLEWPGQAPEDDQKPGAQQVQIGVARFQKLLADALEAYSLTPDPWVRFQLDGRYIQGVRMALEKGRWRFAVKTVTLTDPHNSSQISLNPNAQPPVTPIAGDPNAFSDGAVSPGYACRMLKPNDWLRTLRVYYSYRDGIRPAWIDVDFRDELGAIHANYNPLQMRYVSRLGLDATQWQSNFRDGVLAFLEYLEARADPKMAAIAKAKLEFYEMQCKEAEILDDTRDVPRVQNASRFVSGRFGVRGSRGIAAEEAWPPWG